MCDDDIPGPAYETVVRGGRMETRILNWEDGMRWYRRHMMTNNSLEIADREAAKHAVAPRVSLDDIKAQIKDVYYFTAAQACEGAGYQEYDDSLMTFTFCLIVMKNGFVIQGQSAPASPENFNADYGKELAYNDAVRQIWRLMGFSLRDRLASRIIPSDHPRG